MGWNRIEVEVVNLKYSDFKEFLDEFYDPEKREFPKDIPEWIAKRFLEKSGLEVIKIFPTLAHLSEETHEKRRVLEKVFSLPHNKLLLELIGAPDFYVYGTNEKFFAEVKTDSDALRINQLEWMWKHPQFKVKLIVVENWWSWSKEFRREQGIDNIHLSQLTLTHSSKWKRSHL